VDELSKAYQAGAIENVQAFTTIDYKTTKQIESDSKKWVKRYLKTKEG